MIATLTKALILPRTSLFVVFMLVMRVIQKMWRRGFKEHTPRSGMFKGLELSMVGS